MFVPKLSGHCSNITKLFIQKLSRMCLQTFFSRIKNLMVFVPKLSYQQCIKYHAIQTEISKGVFQAPLMSKMLPPCSYLELSRSRCTNYHVIYTKVIGVFEGKISLVKIINSIVRILPRYLHRSQQGYGFQQILYQGKKRVITVFLHELSARLCVYYKRIYIELIRLVFQ